MRNALVCAAATAVLGLTPAFAQRTLTDPEMSMCVAYTDFADRLFNEWKTVDRQLSNYSLNKSSQTSVNNYNRLVSVANKLHVIVKSWNSYLDDKCGSVNGTPSGFQKACKIKHFGLSFENNNFCKGWKFASNDDGKKQINSASMSSEALGVSPHATQLWDTVEGPNE